MSRPLVYIFHGECRLPIDTEIYTGCTALPNPTVHVRRNPGKVTVTHLKEMGLTIDAELQHDANVKRVEIIAARAYARYHTYVEELYSSGLERLDFTYLDFERIMDFYQRAINDKKIFTLYTASPWNDPRESDTTEIALMLHFARDSYRIEEAFRRLREEDERYVSVHKA